MLYILFVFIFIFVIGYSVQNKSSGGDKFFLLVRHSERLDETNEKVKIQYKYDTPITSNMLYFNKFYKYFGDVIKKFNVIYCSPFTRCIQTALLIKKAHKAKICLEPGLIEISSLEYYINNDYFSNANIYNRFNIKDFDTEYKPAFSTKKISKYLEKDYTYEVIKDKLKKLMCKLPSGIMVSHREIISVTDGINDDYCGAAYVKFSPGKNIILLNSF